MGQVNEGHSQGYTCRDSNPGSLRQVCTHNDHITLHDHLEEIEAIEKGLIRGGEAMWRVNYYKLEASQEARNTLKFPISIRKIGLPGTQHICCKSNDKIKEDM